MTNDILFTRTESVLMSSKLPFLRKHKPAFLLHAFIGLFFLYYCRNISLYYDYGSNKSSHGRFAFAKVIPRGNIKGGKEAKVLGDRNVSPPSLAVLVIHLQK